MARSGAKRKWKGSTLVRANVRRICDDELMAAQPHRAILPENVRMSAKAVTLLGRLNLLGYVSDDQYEAGVRYKKLFDEYARSINVPMGDSGGITAGKGYPCLGQRSCDPCECHKRKVRYNEVLRVLETAGSRAVHAVAKIAINDMPGPTQDDLRRGLDALVGHFNGTRGY